MAIRRTNHFLLFKTFIPPPKCRIWKSLLYLCVCELTAKYDVTYEITVTPLLCVCEENLASNYFEHAKDEGKPPKIKNYEALDPREKERSWDDGWGICDIAEVSEVKSLTVDMTITVIEDRVLEKDTEYLTWTFLVQITVE